MGYYEAVFKQAKELKKDAQIIEDEISKYILGANNGKKMSIRCIKHLIAQMGRECAVLYGDLGEK